MISFCFGVIGNDGNIGAVGKVAPLLQRQLFMGNVHRQV